MTDISWSRVTNPSEVLSLGQEIDVKILSFDKEKLRVSLGLKQIQNDPWETIEGKYSVGGVYEATVSNLTDYGCFAELEQGVEGLIHLSELDWTNRNTRRRTLKRNGLKAAFCTGNAWEVGVK